MGEEIAKKFKEEDAFTCQFEGKGNQYYISAEGIGYNGWHIVLLVRSPDVLIQSKTFLKSVVVTGVTLIALTALLCMVLSVFLLRQRMKLNLEKERYAVLSQFSDTVLFEYDFETDEIEFTSNAAKLLSIDELHLKNISQNDYVLTLLHPDDRPLIRKMFRLPPDARTEETRYAEARLKTTDGEYCWFGCQYKYLIDKANSLTRIIGKLVDITNQRGREQSLMDQAQKDYLTDIYNKAGESVINQRLHEEQSGLFFMLDLDDFKKVNDIYGHITGDAVLSGVGVMLKEVFSEEDIIARVGGDEFVALISGRESTDLAEEKARVILEKIRTIPAAELMAEPLSVSIGIAVCPRDGGAFQELYAAADQAMYGIKKNAKGGFAFYRQSDR